jgi:hypothetical protein
MPTNSERSVGKAMIVGKTKAARCVQWSNRACSALIKGPIQDWPLCHTLEQDNWLGVLWMRRTVRDQAQWSTKDKQSWKVLIVVLLSDDRLS